MYQAAVVAIGGLISVMLAMNAGLERAVGQLRALFIIHAAGLVAVSLILALRRERLRLRSGLPPFYYLAGAMGAGLTVINNWTVTAIGMALTLSLGIFGQLAASAAIDQWGFFGMTRRPFKPGKVLGFALMAAGIAVMAFGGEA